VALALQLKRTLRRLLSLALALLAVLLGALLGILLQILVEFFTLREAALAGHPSPGLFSLLSCLLLLLDELGQILDRLLSQGDEGYLERVGILLSLAHLSADARHEADTSANRSTPWAADGAAHLSKFFQ
jgi:hypothetical protein